MLLFEPIHSLPPPFNPMSKKPKPNPFFISSFTKSKNVCPPSYANPANYPCFPISWPLNDHTPQRRSKFPRRPVQGLKRRPPGALSASFSSREHRDLFSLVIFLHPVPLIQLSPQTLRTTALSLRISFLLSKRKNSPGVS